MIGKALSLSRFRVPGRDFARSAVVVWGAVALTAACAAGGRIVPAVSGASSAAGSWRTAAGVPGLGALNTGGNARVSSVSCASAGNCAAGGYYQDRAGLQGFVAVERQGRWGRAIEVPGLGALNMVGQAEVSSVSCASAGNCAAGGYYQDRAGLQGFVAVERQGRWGRVIEVPGLAALNVGAGLNVGVGAAVTSVSCASAGNCAAGGYYEDRSGNERGFVAAERQGRWGTAIQVPGLAALTAGGDAEVSSVSCGSPGNCAAGGQGAAGGPGFVAVERNGRWGTAIKMPGAVNSVSCASAGSCAAGGTYHREHGGGWQGFVAVERNGRWGTAVQVPGLAALNTGGFAAVSSVSCGSPGNCAVGGDYLDRRFDHPQAFVASENNGVWGTATEVPGLRALNVGRIAGVSSVSCASAGNCAAGGFYFDRSRHVQVFVASQDNGVWGTAIPVPGLAALDQGGEESRSPAVSCARAGPCAAGGYYTDASGHAQGFAVTQTG